MKSDLTLCRYVKPRLDRARRGRYSVSQRFSNFFTDYGICATCVVVLVVSSRYLVDECRTYVLQTFIYLCTMLFNQLIIRHAFEKANLAKCRSIGIR